MRAVQKNKNNNKKKKDGIEKGKWNVPALWRFIALLMSFWVYVNLNDIFQPINP